MASLTPSNKEELRPVETLGSSVSPSTSCERDASVDAEDQSDPLMSDESSFGTNPLTTDLSSRKDTDKALHDQEERSICGARFLFLVILLIAAVSLGAMVYLITQSDAQSDFEIEFINSSTEVWKFANERVHKTMANLQKLSIVATTVIVTKKESSTITTLPDSFITIDGVENLFGLIRETNGATVVGYSPIVKQQEFNAWAQYSQGNAMAWIEQAHMANNSEWFAKVPNFVNEGGGTSDEEEEPEEESKDNSVKLVPNFEEVLSPITPYIWFANEFREAEHAHHHEAEEIQQESLDGTMRIPERDAPATPLWQISPPPYNPSNPINWNLQSFDEFKVAIDLVHRTAKPVFAEISCSASIFLNPVITCHEFHDSLLVAPVFDRFMEEGMTGQASIVGYVFAVVPWRNMFVSMLVEDSEPINVRLQSSCIEHSHSISIDGAQAHVIHDWDPTYDHIEWTESFVTFTPTVCSFTIHTFPTAEFEEEFFDSGPWIYVAIVLSLFAFTCCGFILFDAKMFSRQKKLIETATKQNAIVSSLFPKSIQKKLMEDLEDGVHRKNNKSGTANLKRYLHGERDVPLSSMVGGDADGGAAGLLSKPIADLFPETTIMFADIAGFTAWSSVREPSQVFTLLESIYCEFDAVANRRRVFKVEVVGDCYVAVAGLPDARPNHALVMAKFARDCVNLMATTTSKLEVTLGPDTGELMIRVGLHSGPVVAGVLRGDKSRFQLFGDTMNTASRMESTGVAGRIQVSKETAERIAKHGKEHWLVQRENKITAKGKGEMTTYFLNIPGHDAGSHGACSLGSSELVSPNESNVPGVKQSDPQELEAKRNRIADWTVEALTSLLKAILAHRKAENTRTDPRELIKHLEEASLTHSNVIDEVAEVVTLPNYHQLYHKNTQQTIELSQSVIEQLRHYVQMIASLYNDNPFHNFDHANHVVMSVNKLLSRITAPDLDVDEDGKTLHDHTYGITSDPLTWFACVFSALIHDVDHSGAPNSQLVKEKAPIAVLYNGKAVAEQNSFDIAWDLLMDPTYEDLRKVLYCNKTEFKRFRQLVVNSVMATDIVDIDLKNLRNARWEMAFKEDSVEGSTGSSPHSSASEVNRKATVVIEHLIQASDVAHTMQHWHVYRRWNEKFFMECYQAYLDGRAENNPATNWYKGEIGFFDFYIIPLAKKLKDCGVFGVSSDEYLSYALQNRKEWEERGEEIVAGMVKAVSEHQDLSQAQAKTIQSTGVGCLE